ncbi:MAG: hypothetical protein KJ698_01200 [Actinobacteria bacterium]|nr:hypothetical protein [Actinomycetota bacterium]MBU1494088.1 hypothetical protein [Actinomycetota bacterium]
MHTEPEPWSATFGYLAASLFRSGRRAGPTPPSHLRLLRVLTVAWAGSLALILLVLWLVRPTEGAYPAGLLAVWAALAAAGWAGQQAADRWTRREIGAAADAPEAVAAYRSGFFIKTACAEIGALFALGVVLATDTGLLPYLIALPVSLAMLAAGAPRARHLAILQADIDAAGGSIKIVNALMAPASA